MNAAVRAVVRFGLYLGCKVYFIREGYQGMVSNQKFVLSLKCQQIDLIKGRWRESHRGSHMVCCIWNYSPWWHSNWICKVL